MSFIQKSHFSLVPKIKSFAIPLGRFSVSDKPSSRDEGVSATDACITTLPICSGIRLSVLRLVAGAETNTGACTLMNVDFVSEIDVEAGVGAKVDLSVTTKVDGNNGCVRQLI